MGNLNTRYANWTSNEKLCIKARNGILLIKM